MIADDFNKQANPEATSETPSHPSQDDSVADPQLARRIKKIVDRWTNIPT